MACEIETAEFFSLKPLGFAGWEHTEALKSENGRRTMFLRRTGHLLPYLIVVGRGCCAFKAVANFIGDRERYDAHRPAA